MHFVKSENSKYIPKKYNGYKNRLMNVLVLLLIFFSFVLPAVTITQQSRQNTAEHK